jgi:uncharacterized membrane protein YdjX (TVP38/TMEM64 family)
MDQPATPAPRRRVGWVRPAAVALVLVAAVVAGRAFGIGGRIGEARQWILSLGAWAPVVFVLVYAVAVVFAMPGSVLTVAAGAMFGALEGVVLVSIASTLGATGAFLVARFAARDAIVRWLSGNQKFAKLDRLTRDHGAIIVAITRLVPLFPFNLLNYGFGLTQVPLATYVGWSWLCMLPGTVLYVVGADAVTTALAQGRVPWVLVGALVVTLIGLAFLVRRARAVLAAREEQRTSKEATP